MRRRVTNRQAWVCTVVQLCRQSYMWLIIIWNRPRVLSMHSNTQEICRRAGAPREIKGASLCAEQGRERAPAGALQGACPSVQGNTAIRSVHSWSANILNGSPEPACPSPHGPAADILARCLMSDAGPLGQFKLQGGAGVHCCHPLVGHWSGLESGLTVNGGAKRLHWCAQQGIMSPMSLAGV